MNIVWFVITLVLTLAVGFVAGFGINKVGVALAVKEAVELREKNAALERRIYLIGERATDAPRGGDGNS